MNEHLTERFRGSQAPRNVDEGAAGLPQEQLSNNVERYLKRSLHTEEIASWCRMSEIPTTEEILTPVNKYYNSFLEKCNVLPLSSSSDKSSTTANDKPSVAEAAAHAKPWSAATIAKDAWENESATTVQPWNPEPAADDPWSAEPPSTESWSIGTATKEQWSAETVASDNLWVAEPRANDAWSSDPAANDKPWGDDTAPHDSSSDAEKRLSDIPSGASAGAYTTCIVDVDDGDADDADSPQSDFYLRPSETNKIHGPWSSKERYLRTHYKLARADSTTSLRQLVAYVRGNPKAIESTDFSNWSIYDSVWPPFNIVTS